MLPYDDCRGQKLGHCVRLSSLYPRRDRSRGEGTAAGRSPPTTHDSDEEGASQPVGLGTDGCQILTAGRCARMSATACAWMIAGVIGPPWPPRNTEPIPPEMVPRASRLSCSAHPDNNNRLGMAPGCSRLVYLTGPLLHATIPAVCAALPSTVQAVLPVCCS